MWCTKSTYTDEAHTTELEKLMKELEFKEVGHAKFRKDDLVVQKVKMFSKE